MADDIAPSALKRSIARRALVALLLTIGFYTLALFMMGVLLFIPFIAIQLPFVFAKLLIVCGAGFFAILVAIIPRRDKFDAPWPRLTAEEHPRLFEKLAFIAARAKQPLPGEVYLLPDFNAWVADRGGRFGGGRRVMGIGLPLLQVLDVSQFTAVIAHEFGHYCAGDTRLGPWIYRTRIVIGRTMANLSGGSVAIVRAPFNAYARMFLRVTHSVSREQEYSADRFAASITGREPMASALKRLAGYDPGVTLFWHRLVLPALGRGFRPPITGGMVQMLASDRITNVAAKFTETVLKEEKQDPFDTHPCLRDRVAALEGLPAGDAGETTPAISLLDNIRGVEDRIVAMYLPPERIATLEEIEWDDVAERVFLNTWSELRERNGESLSMWTVEEIPVMIEKAGEIAPGLFDAGGRHVRPQVWSSLFVDTVHAALALALRDAGWTLVARPDYGYQFVQGDKCLDSGAMFDTLVSPQADEHVVWRVDQARWAHQCKEAGIFGMLLSGGMAPAGREPRLPQVPGTPSIPVPGASEPGHGEGATVETAIVIHSARSLRQRTDAEFAWLSAAFGEVRVDWAMTDHSNTMHNGRSIDTVVIELKGGQRRVVYFDITD